MSRWATTTLAVVLSSALLIAGCGSPDGGAGPSAPEETPPATVVREASGQPTTVAGVQAGGSDVEAWVAVTPRLTVAGQQVSAAGQGFTAGETVDVVLLDAAGQAVAGPVSATADPRGAFSAAALPLPAQLAAGDYTVAARGTTSERQSRAPLWIRAAPPALELSRDALRPDESFAISGSGFAPRERVVIYFEGQGAEPLTALTTDQLGNFRAANVPVPMLAPGEQQLVATGSISLAKARHAFKVLEFDPVAVLNASTVPPGEPVGFFGYGFAARDRIDIALEGSNEPWITASTDDRGRLAAPEAFKLPSNIEGQQAFTLRAQRTGRTIRVPFLVIRSYPLVALSSYFGKSGSEVVVTARNLRPRERYEVFVGEGGQRKKIGSFRADDNGTLATDSRFRIPQEAAPGTLLLSMEGEAARPPLYVKFTVTP